jgi:hypothetical protein
VIDSAGMSDRDEITERLNLYSWAIDTKQCELLTELFAVDVVAEYGTVRWNDRATLIQDMIDFHDRVGATQHLIGGHRVAIDGATATATTNSQNVLQRDVEGQTIRYASGTRYEDELRRGREGWRVVRRRAVHLWSEGDRRVVQDFFDAKS